VWMIERRGGARLAHQPLTRGGVGAGYAARTIFSATWRRSRVSSASHTSPMPPLPRWLRIR
jgi:hypothetical protein